MTGIPEGFGGVEDMALPPLDEYIVAEMARAKDALSDLISKYENIVNHLADVCRRNAKMQTAGDRMRDLLDILWTFPMPDSEHDDTEVEKAISDWGNANV